MTTILIAFGIIELVILLGGFLSFLWLKELETLLGCAFLVYGTGFNALAFVITLVVHDHVHVSLH